MPYSNTRLTTKEVLGDINQIQSRIPAKMAFIGASIKFRLELNDKNSRPVQARTLQLLISVLRVSDIDL